MSSEASNTWFVVDKEGLRKTLSRKGKAFAIYELLQNGYDENSTKLEVTLTEPKNGKSVLTCIDNAPRACTFEPRIGLQVKFRIAPGPRGLMAIDVELLEDSGLEALAGGVL